MKKKIFAPVLCFCMALLILPISVFADSAWTDEGNYNAELYATAPGDWEINDEADFAAFVKKTRGGNDFAGYTVKLNADISIDGHTWVPVGDFWGTFDGQGHTISGSVVSGSEQNLAIFSFLRNGKIMNLHSACNFSSSGGTDTHVGGICAYNFGGTIENCLSTGNISSTAGGTFNQVGGICGYNHSGTIKNCVSTGTVTAENSMVNNAGSIMGGGSSPTLANCYGSTAGNGATLLPGAQMKAAAGETDAAWVEISVGGTTGKMAMIDALQLWINAQAEPLSYYGWKADSATAPQNGGYPLLDSTPRVIYNGMGGVNIPSHHLLLSAVSETVPFRPRYAFLGWATTPTGAASVMPAQLLTEAKSVTLYAVWLPMNLQFSGTAVTGEGTVTAAVASSIVGDTYLNTDTLDLYLCTAEDEWTLTANLKGDPGEKGAQGEDGTPGTPGENGEQGTPGAKGDTGDPGTPGVKGDTGAQGVKGDTGAQGVKGDTGAQGVKGDTGAQGAKGEKGDMGEPGNVLWITLASLAVNVAAIVVLLFVARKNKQQP